MAGGQVDRDLALVAKGTAVDHNALDGPGLDRGIGQGPVGNLVAGAVADRVGSEGVMRQQRIEGIVHQLSLPVAGDLDLVLDARALGQMKGQMPQIEGLVAGEGLEIRRAVEPVLEAHGVGGTAKDEGGAQVVLQREGVRVDERGHRRLAQRWVAGQPAESRDRV